MHDALNRRILSPQNEKICLMYYTRKCAHIPIDEISSSYMLLTLSCARPTANGRPLCRYTVRWKSVNYANAAFHPFGGR